MKKIATSILIFLSLLTFAQAPQKMSYQSVVRNAANQILENQSIAVKISIVEGSLTGTTVYSETHTTTTNSNGLFTIEAGGGTPTLGTFSVINWGNGSHYIKSEIDVTGGTNYTLSGTMELLSVPYALYAGKTLETTQLQTQIASLQTQLTTLENVVLPNFSTIAVSNITGETAMSGVSITFLGIIIQSVGGEFGLVWSTNRNPTIALETKVSTGYAPTGEQPTGMSGLLSNTTYYVRSFVTQYDAYQTTFYGNEISFTTSDPYEIVLGDTINDIDGNSYNTVLFGTQQWTKENLNVATYSDGTLIPQVTSPTQWASLTTGAWCYYNNDPANSEIYGKLYNWYAVAGIYDAASLTNPILRKQLAPIGWHVPTDAEWTTLIDFLGGYTIAGTSMKATNGWVPQPGIYNTNTSGFSGLPGGTYSNTFQRIREMGYWWSSSNNAISLSFYENTINNGNYLGRTNGSSVRCVKNQ